MLITTGVEPFRGTNSKKCEEFIQAIIGYAFRVGKQRDDEWIAEFAATRLHGRALRWHTDQDDATQRSWKLLKKALFEHWPAESESDLGRNTTTRPSPGLATPSQVSLAAPDMSFIPPDFPSISTSLPEDGILSIQDVDTGAIVGYLGKTTWSTSTCVCYVKDRSEAVSVQVTPKYEIVLLNMEWEPAEPLILALAKERSRTTMEDGMTLLSHHRLSSLHHATTAH